MSVAASHIERQASAAKGRADKPLGDGLERVLGNNAGCELAAELAVGVGEHFVMLQDAGAIRLNLLDADGLDAALDGERDGDGVDMDGAM